MDSSEGFSEVRTLVFMSHVITNISQAKRNSERVNLYLNGAFWLGISKNDMVALKLIKERILTQEEKEKIEAVAASGKLLERAYRFVALRPRSVSEVKSYLIYRKKYTEEETQQVIEKLTDLGMLSDERFAEWYTTYKLSSGTQGHNKIKAELLTKGVSLKIITNVLSKHNEDPINATEQGEKLKAFAQKLIKTVKAKDAYDLKQKVTNRLLGRGFSYSEVKATLKELIDIQKV